MKEEGQRLLRWVGEGRRIVQRATDRECSDLKANWNWVGAREGRDGRLHPGFSLGQLYICQWMVLVLGLGAALAGTR